MNVDVELIQAGSPAFEDFQRLPWKVYEGDPRWIPSDPAFESAQLSSENAFLRYGQLQIFGVRVDGELVARCVAMLNPRIQAPEQPVGLVGFFDALDDYAAAEAVLEAATSWLRERGAQAIWGPMNFSVWHSYRFMTAGFEQIPYLGEPYNPRYYPEFFERFGFERMNQWRSWDLVEPHLRAILAAAQQVPREVLDQAGFTTRIFGPDDFDAFMPLSHQILTEGFQENVGFSTIDFDDYLALYEPLKPLMVPGASPLLVFDPAGEVAAYGYVYPDLGPQVRAQAGLPEPDLKGITSPYRGKRLVLHTMVVVKKYRKLGIPNALMAQDVLSKTLEEGFTQAIGAVAKEGRTGYDKIGEHTREYWLYQLA